MSKQSKVLIVDDEERNVKLIQAYLKNENYQLLKAYNGEQAIQVASDEHPDVILLDIMMPDMNGYNVTQRLKSNKFTKNIPIILVTALDGSDNRIRGLEVGADEFLTKPVNRHELIARMRSLLKMKQMHDELENRHSIAKKLLSIDSKQEYIARVLVVEDEDILSQQMQLVLQDQDFQVIIAHNLTEAEKIVAENPPDVVILDRVLPDGDGLQMLREWTDTPTLTEMPVIILTVLNDLASKIEGIDQGADDYLVKPLDNSELVARVRAALRRANARKKLKNDIVRLHQGAVTDRLTGLHNRRYLDVDLEYRFAQAKRKPELGFSIIMIDIDYFKSINDQFGHLYGDQVLREVASCLLSSARNADIVTRYGGEEFCTILPDTDIESAIRIAERMRATIEKHAFSDLRHYKVTASFGVSCFNPSDSDILEVIARADAALYQAKGAGRNSVVCTNKD